MICSRICGPGIAVLIAKERAFGILLSEPLGHCLHFGSQNDNATLAGLAVGLMLSKLPYARTEIDLGSGNGRHFARTRKLSYFVIKNQQPNGG